MIRRILLIVWVGLTMPMVIVKKRNKALKRLKSEIEKIIYSLGIK